MAYAPTAPRHMALSADMSRDDRLWLLEAMVASRVRRRAVADARRQGRMAPAAAGSQIGWEPVEAAATRVLTPPDVLLAGPAWPAPLAPGRIGGEWCLTDPLAAGVGAAIGGAPGSVALVLCGSGWGAEETAALRMAVRWRAPLIALAAVPHAPASFLQAAAGTAESVFEQVLVADVERTAVTIERACSAARAGQGPTLIACIRDPEARNGRGPAEEPPDPVEAYARKLIEVGVPIAKISEVARVARERT